MKYNAIRKEKTQKQKKKLFSKYNLVCGKHHVGLELYNDRTCIISIRTWRFIKCCVINGT